MIRISSKYLAVFMLLLSQLGCDKEEEITSREYPRLNTLAATEIGPEGARFNAEFLLRGNVEIEKYGFVWSRNKYFEIESLETWPGNQVVYSENIGEDGFSEFIQITLQRNQVYFVRAFVKTKDFLVIGNDISFLSKGSKGPELKSFSPEAGHVDTEIELTATSFGENAHEVDVFINGIDALITSFSRTSITARIPDRINKEEITISVSVAGNNSAYDKKFRIYKPLISDVAPKEVTFGGVVEIHGEHFDTREGRTGVSFDTPNGTLFTGEVIDITENKITTRVPQEMNQEEMNLIVSMNNMKTVDDTKIHLSDPVLFPLTNNVVEANAGLTIYGKHFSSVPGNNRVLIDGKAVDILAAANDSIQVKLADQFSHIYSGREVTFSVEVLDSEVEAQEKLKLGNKWFRHSNLKFSGHSWKGMSMNEKGYVLYPNGLWKYEPRSRSWTSGTGFPAAITVEPGVFSMPGKIFVVAGKQFWEYETGSDTWNRKNDFPGKSATSQLAFSYNRTGYVGVGRDSERSWEGTNEMWKYTETTDSWAPIAPYPATNAETIGHTGAVSTVVNGAVITGLGTSNGTANNEMYKLDPATDQWSRIDDYPSANSNYHKFQLAFTLEDKAVFGSYYHQVFHAFMENYWAPAMKSKRGYFDFVFVIDNIAYFGGGYDADQFWEYDASQPY